MGHDNMEAETGSGSENSVPIGARAVWLVWTKAWCAEGIKKKQQQYMQFCGGFRWQNITAHIRSILCYTCTLLLTGLLYDKILII